MFAAVGLVFYETMAVGKSVRFDHREAAARSIQTNRIEGAAYRSDSRVNDWSVCPTILPLIQLERYVQTSCWLTERPTRCNRGQLSRVQV